jgi:hypothetical protein
MRSPVSRRATCGECHLRTALWELLMADKSLAVNAGLAVVNPQSPAKF